MTKSDQNITQKAPTRTQRMAHFVARQSARRSPDAAKRLNATALAMMAAHAAEAASNVVWLVGNTAPGREFVAQADIADAGFAAYVPTATEWRKTKSGSRELITVPLISRMVFVGATSPADGVFDAIGADVAQSADDRPGGLLIVPGHVLREFVTRVADPVVAICEHPRFAFNVGQRVDVTEGPFIGFKADVTAMRGDRVRIRVTILGGETDAEIGARSLRECA